MANKEHLDKLLAGRAAWSEWRETTGYKQVDLTETHFSHLTLNNTDLRRVDFRNSVFSNCMFHSSNFHLSSFFGARMELCLLENAYLMDADLRDTTLVASIFDEARLRRANLSQAKLNRCTLMRADLTDAALTGVTIEESNLSGALLVNANLDDAVIEKTYLHYAVLNNASLQKSRIVDSCIFGVAAWGLDLTGAAQHGLNIDPPKNTVILNRYDEPASALTVENIETAQFLNLLLDNKKIKDVIDQATSKVVLILGRFTPERKAILDALRQHLRGQGFVAVIFDFEKPSTRNLTETVATVAQLAKFIVADLTDAKSIPQELQRIIPDNPSLPIQPIISASQYEYAMFKDFLDYHSVLTPYRYEDLETLLGALEEKVVAPALAKLSEVESRRKAMEQTTTKRAK